MAAPDQVPTSTVDPDAKRLMEEFPDLDPQGPEFRQVMETDRAYQGVRKELPMRATLVAVPDEWLTPQVKTPTVAGATTNVGKQIPPTTSAVPYDPAEWTADSTRHADLTAEHLVDELELHAVLDPEGHDLVDGPIDGQTGWSPTMRLIDAVRDASRRAAASPLGPDDAVTAPEGRRRARKPTEIQLVTPPSEGERTHQALHRLSTDMDSITPQVLDGRLEPLVQAISSISQPVAMALPRAAADHIVALSNSLTRPGALVPTLGEDQDQLFRRVPTTDIMTFMRNANVLADPLGTVRSFVAGSAPSSVIDLLQAAKPEIMRAVADALREAVMTDPTLIRNAKRRERLARLMDVVPGPSHDPAFVARLQAIVAASRGPEQPQPPQQGPRTRKLSDRASRGLASRTASGSEDVGGR